MTDAQTASAPPQKHPRSGPGTWKRHYCDPAVSPKHAKGRAGGSPRTSPQRTPRSDELDFPVVQEIAAILATYERHQEPPDVVADVLLRVLPMPDCARSTIALVFHRKGTGSCDDLTYRQAGTLGRCDRRTAINRFARTASYGFIRIEQCDHPWGGAAPNLVTMKVPSWVYEQVDEYNAIPASLRPPPRSAVGAPESAGGAPSLGASPALVETVAAGPAVPAEAGAAPDKPVGPVTAAVVSHSASAAPSASDSAATATGVLATPAGTEPSPPAPPLSPEDAAIDARLDVIHAFTGQRFQVAEIRGFNAKVPKRAPGVGVPNLEDEHLLLALDEYIKKQRPVFEHRAKYPKFRKRLDDREWVEDGIHVFLGYKRALLAGIDPHQLSQGGRQGSDPQQLQQGERKGHSRAATRRPRASAPVNLAAAAAPVQLGATFEQHTTIVRAVSAGSIAARLLLQPGDKVVRVDDQAIGGPDDLRTVLSTMVPGLHTFELVRWNEVVTATVTLEPRGPPST